MISQAHPWFAPVFLGLLTSLTGWGFGCQGVLISDVVKINLLVQSPKDKLFIQAHAKRLIVIIQYEGQYVIIYAFSGLKTSLFRDVSTLLLSKVVV